MTRPVLVARARHRDLSTGTRERDPGQHLRRRRGLAEHDLEVGPGVLADGDARVLRGLETQRASGRDRDAFLREDGRAIVEVDLDVRAGPGLIRVARDVAVAMAG